MPRNYLVYRITYKTKSYIGLTGNSLDWRIGRHHRNPESVIGRALRLHGRVAFQREVLADNLTFEQACTLEKYYIRIYETIVPGGYNVAVGGRASQSFSSEERRQNCYKRSLTWSDVKRIRELAKVNTMPVIAQIYGITRHQVNKILHNRQWKDPKYVPAYLKQIDRSGKVVMWQPNLF